MGTAWEVVWRATSRSLSAPGGRPWKRLGLSVEVGRLAYVREFVEPGYHHCEVFFVATSYTGTLVTGRNPGTGVFDIDHIIKDARFVRRDEMAGMTIYPEEIKTAFWDDLAKRLLRNQVPGGIEVRDQDVPRLPGWGRLTGQSSVCGGASMPIEIPIGPGGADRGKPEVPGDPCFFCEVIAGRSEKGIGGGD